MHGLKRCGLLLLALGAFWSSGSQAQNFPSKPIRIHTTGAGGGTDLVTRLVAAEIGPVLGQTIVVENQPNPALLATGVAKATPDGHTLLTWGPAFWVGPLFEEASYNALRDFVAVSGLTRSPNILVVSNTIPAKTVAEFISYAKSRPGELNYSTGANGSSAHIAGELFKSMTGTNIVRITYKGGTAQETLDLMSGQLHATFGSGAAWAAQIKAGKLRGLGTGGVKRSSLFPDLPTIGESLPGFVSESVLGMFAPAKTPDAVVRRLNQEVVKALDKPEVRASLLKTGGEPAGGPPEQLADVVKSEVTRVSKLIKDGAK